MRNQTIVVDINKEICRILRYKQYDNNNLLQIIVEKDDERVSLNGYTGYAFFKLPSGLVIKKDCSVQGSEVTINIDNNVLSESGKIALDLTLSDGNETFTLFRINLVIEESIDKDDAIIVEAGWDIVSEIAKINKKIENLGGNGGNNTDLSGYATKDELNNKADKSSIPTKVSQLENDKGYLTSVPSEYITETELNNKGYLTEHQDLSNYATKSYVDSEIAKAQLGGGDTGIDLSGYATKDELNSKADKTEINSLTSLIVTLESQINALRSDVDSLLQNSGGGDSGNNIPCTSVSITPTSYTFTSIGEEYKLSASVTPSNTTDKILWSTTNSAIAQVTNGTVTPVGNGECTITATCGNYSDTCLITVNIEESVNTYSITNNLTNVSTNNSATSIEEGQSYDAILTCGNDYEISSVVVTMNDVDVTNSVYEPEYSEDPEVRKGTINILNVTGNIIITAIAEKIESGGSTISCTDISLNPTQFTFTSANETQKIIATLTPSNTTDTLSWESSNNSIATVDQFGNVTSKAEGSCTITATCGTKSAVCNVVVNIESSGGGGGGSESTEITSLSIYPATKKVYVGAMGYLLPKVEPVSACAELDKIEWSVSDPSAVLLESSGRISVIEEGTFTVTAKIGSHTATCQIVAEGTDVVPCTKLIINPTSMSVEAGKKAFIDVTYEPENTTDFVSFDSSDLGSCTVSPYGLVTTKSPWSFSDITVTCGDQTEVCSVNVLEGSGSSSEGACQSLQIEPSSITLDKTGDTYQLTITTVPADTTDSLKISITDPNIARVNLSGLVTAVAKGSCTITASCGGCRASCDVTVEQTVEQEDPYENFDRNPQYQTAVYTNPNITIENHLIKLEQDGYVEYFNPFQEEPHDVDFKTITDGDDTYYLTLKDQSYSKFSVDGKRPIFHGYYENENSLGDSYEFNSNAVPIRRGWDIEVMCKDNTLTTECFDDILEHLNSQIPALNYHRVDSSMSFIEYNEYPEETYLGVTLTYSSYFEVYLNKTLLEEYTTLPKNFLSTAVHELGHTLGLRDYPAYYPSLLHYERDRSIMTLLQPNDVYALKCFYKAHDLELVTPFEESLRIIIPVDPVNIEATASELDKAVVKATNFIEEPIIFMDYAYCEDLIAESDVIVECSLKFIRNESLKTNNTTNIPYKIYEIQNENIINGELIKTEVKIAKANDLLINEDCRYKLYLKDCPTTPYSLINPYQGIEKL